MAFNEILRMHEDLERALRKPIKERSWIMVIDARRCVGDHACAVACMAENVCPPGTSYRKVFETEYKGYPRLDRFFMPANCQHCDNPPCMKAANKHKSGAIEKMPDGIVVFNYKRLSRNSSAIKAAKDACPYYAIVEDNGGYYRWPVRGRYHCQPPEGRQGGQVFRMARSGGPGKTCCRRISQSRNHWRHNGHVS